MGAVENFRTVASVLSSLYIRNILGPVDQRFDPIMGSRMLPAHTFSRVAPC